MNKSTLYGIIFGILIGYIFAAFMIRRDTYLSMTSGEMIEEFNLFPFSDHISLSDRAFPLLFPSQSNGIENKIILTSSRRPFVNGLGLASHSYSSGDQMLAHQRMLLESYNEANFTKDERKKIANTYFSKLTTESRGRASEYVMKVWEEAAQSQGK